MAFPRQPSKGDRTANLNSTWDWDGTLWKKRRLRETGTGTLPTITADGRHSILTGVSNQSALQVTIYATRNNGNEWQEINLHLMNFFSQQDIHVQYCKGSSYFIEEVSFHFVGGKYTLAAKVTGTPVDINVTWRSLGDIFGNQSAREQLGGAPSSDYPGTVYSVKYTGTKYDKPWSSSWGRLYSARKDKTITAGNVFDAGPTTDTFHAAPGRWIEVHAYVMKTDSAYNLDTTNDMYLETILYDTNDQIVAKRGQSRGAVDTWNMENPIIAENRGTFLLPDDFVPPMSIGTIYRFHMSNRSGTTPMGFFFLVKDLGPKK